MKDEDSVVLALFAMMLAALVFVFVAFPAKARDLDGKYADSPLNGWFKSLKSKAGVPCCDTADGLRLEDVDWESRDGHYRVRIEGQWYDVPAEAVLEQPNKLGPAIIWPFKYGDGPTQIRCFIPGAGS